MRASAFAHLRTIRDKCLAETLRNVNGGKLARCAIRGAEVTIMLLAGVRKVSSANRPLWERVKADPGVANTDSAPGVELTRSVHQTALLTDEALPQMAWLGGRSSCIRHCKGPVSSQRRTSAAPSHSALRSFDCDSGSCNCPSCSRPPGAKDIHRP